MVTKAIFDFHENSRIGEIIDKIHPKSTSRLGVENAIEVWGPEAARRIVLLRTKLSPDDAGHAYILRALDLLEETFLKPGYQDVLRGLVSGQDVVFSHNDV